MADWSSLTTRSNNRPVFRGRRRGRPLGSRNIMPRTKKDFQQDKQISNVKKEIKKMKNDDEISFKDTVITAQTLVSTGTFVLLNGMASGDEDSTREKTLANFTSIQMKLSITTDIDVLGPTFCRIVLVWDRAPNGVTPTTAQLFDSASATALVHQAYNKNYFKRFKFLYDRKFVMNPKTVRSFTPATGLSTALNPIGEYVEFRRQTKRQTNYGLGNAGTIADITINACWLLLMSDQATDVALATGGIRMYYKDD